MAWRIDCSSRSTAINTTHQERFGIIQNTVGLEQVNRKTNLEILDCLKPKKENLTNPFFKEAYPSLFEQKGL
jgi:hypothetical protein